MKRLTRQRQVILEGFKLTKRPLSAKEILNIASKELPLINLATIYRNLKTLLEEEVIVHVEVPGQPPRYECRGLSHHHHFLCQRCDRLFDVEGCLPGLTKLIPEGFKLTSHDITLYGFCEQCKAP